MLPLADALVRLEAALLSSGEAAPLAPFRPPQGGVLSGEFEVRSADGTVRRMQPATLALPGPLLRAFAHKAPARNLRIDLGSHALTLWQPLELLELQVGHRWHGFTGKRMPEWDERYVVFAEDGGDPVAMRLDEPEGPVWLSHRGDGRHVFFPAAPSLAAFYLALALFLENRELAALEGALSTSFGEAAQQLWLWRELISLEDARR